MGLEDGKGEQDGDDAEERGDAAADANDAESVTPRPAADPHADQAWAERQSMDGAVGIAERMARLAAIEEQWGALVGPVDPVTSDRQLDALAQRVAELLDATLPAGSAHPSEAVLAPLVARMPAIEGLWFLDTDVVGNHLPQMELMTAYAHLPGLPLRTFGVEGHDVDGAAQHLGSIVELDVSIGSEGRETGDAVHVVLLEQHRHDLPVSRADGRFPALRSEVGRTLERAVASATVLSTCAAPDERWQTYTRPAFDRDAEAARIADRLLELFAGLEHALARQAAGRRNPDRTSAADAEVTYRRELVLGSAKDVYVDVVHRLPENTLEPYRLSLRAATGRGPDPSDVLPVTYRLELDLSEGRRGMGILRTDDWRGRAERAVLLPHVTDLWTEYIESAIRRAVITTRGVRRPVDDEEADPLTEVEMPTGDGEDLIGYVHDLSDVSF